MSPLKNSRTVRWAVPVGTIAVVGAALGTAPVIAAVRGNPSLPPKTAAQLLAAVTQAQKAPPLSGTVVESASLGLPALPGDRSEASPVSLLSGSHTARIWYGDQQHVRLALLDTGSETDYIRNGADSWQWSSAKNTATHSRNTEKQAQKQAEKPAPKPSGTPLTPQQAADRALAMVGKTTTVRVDPTGRVAGHDAYELVLSPKDGRSLIGQVRLALDGKTYVPLRVQVYARGASSPAAQIGFTSVTFTKPAAANFSFKPPAGAKVVESKEAAKAPLPGAGTKQGAASEKQRAVGKGNLAAGKNQAAGKQQAGRQMTGSGWLTVERMSLPQGTQGKDRSGGMTAALQKAASPVHGAWGSGRILRTKLFSALLTDDGRLYVGAVTPDVLTQAAAHR